MVTAQRTVEHTREFGEHAIPRRVRDSTFMLCDELVDYGAAGGQSGEGGVFVTVHQTAIALDIGCEDCCQSPLKRRGFHTYALYDCSWPKSGMQHIRSQWSIYLLQLSARADAYPR
jgi:hypothetical protein